MTKMTDFLTAYGPKPTTKPNAAGNREEITYSERRDENGHPYLIKTGAKNTYEERQSYKGEYDIYSMLERYANGDQTVMRSSASYIDASEMPSNFHEAYNVMQATKEGFERLPVSVKQLFGNDWVQWAALSGTEEWCSKMGIEPKPIVEKPVEEVKPNVDT